MHLKKLMKPSRRSAPFYIVLSLSVIYRIIILSNDEILEDRIIETQVSLDARLFPNNAEVIMNQAWFLSNNMRYSEQVAVLEKYHTRHPETSFSVELMGDGYEALGDYQKAVRCYETAIQMTKRENKPVSPFLRERLARCRKKLNNVSSD